MIELHLDNLLADRVGDNGLTQEDLEQLASRTPAAHETLQGWRESKDACFFDVIADDGILAGIPEKAAEIAERFEHLVVLGIGGSALGLRAAAAALLPPRWNLRDRAARDGRPQLFVCDNIDPESFAALLDQLPLKQTCFTVISKSGRTAETAAQFFVVRERLHKALGDAWREHVVIITDPEGGELRPMVTTEKLASFAIPQKLGGRFSVLSPVGLFPAACCGIDVEGLVAGARAMRSRCEVNDWETNPAYRLGGMHYWLNAKKGNNINVLFTYADALATTAEWYAQLWAESLGKEGCGATPVRALGTTDQHSQVQLYMEGPADKVFTVVGVEHFRTPAEATRVNDVPEAFAYLAGHDLGAILHAEQRATTAALTKALRPNLSITFPEITAEHLGEFFFLYETATAFAGALYGFDPFDQPGVELGKKLTKEYLNKSKEMISDS